MTDAIKYYQKSTPLFTNETIVPWEDFRKYKANQKENGKVILLGRHGNCHQFDLYHIQILQKTDWLGDPKDTSLLLFDWHEDLDNEDGETTSLTSASWVYKGLESSLYHNVYVVGTNPSPINELNSMRTYDDKICSPKGKLMRQMSKIELFPFVSKYGYLKYSPGSEAILQGKESIQEYYVVEKGGFIVVTFKSKDEVSYDRIMPSTIMNIDLDILRRDELRTHCPQGLMTVDELLLHMEKVSDHTSVDTVLICGLSESAELQDDFTLYNLSRILNTANRILMGDDD